MTAFQIHALNEAVVADDSYLRDHEKALLTDLAGTPESNARRLLNGYFLSEEGFSQLQALLRSARYEIDVPEEGALLVVAWLTQQGHIDDARDLLDKLAPYFPRLRFYPIPTNTPHRHGSRVHLQNVEGVIATLNSVMPNRHIVAQRETIEIWSPIYDRIVQLFLETVDGTPPICRVGANSKLLREVSGRYTIEGGWPCQHYPRDWPARALALLDEYQRLRREHKHCAWPDRAKDSFAQLRGYMQRTATSPTSLTARDVGRIRLLLGRYVAKRDLPGSDRCQQIRKHQLQQVGGATHYDIARQLILRLKRFPAKSGLDNLGAVAQPIATEEATPRLDQGTTLPESLLKKVERCLHETIEVLIAKDIITSGETLARVLPQMTSGIRAAGISDPALRHLYAAIYRSFRRRRSLLLLNLEKQVQIEELPWVAAIDRYRNDDLSSAELARQALEEIAALTIRAFPQAIVPDKLLQEFQALAKTAGLDLPLVEEVAADIFMGQFSQKFLDAAKRARKLLDETLYARYYEIDYPILDRMTMSVSKPTWLRREHHDSFLLLCESRAGVRYGTWDAAINGMLIVLC